MTPMQLFANLRRSNVETHYLLLLSILLVPIVVVIVLTLELITLVRALLLQSYRDITLTLSRPIQYMLEDIWEILQPVYIHY